MKVFGHPVHPLLIHFPTALLPMDLAFSLFSYYKQNASFSEAGLYCLIGAVLIGFIAIITGLSDLLGIPRNNKPAIALALYHGAVNGAIILAFALIGYKAWQAYPQVQIPSTAMIVIKSILILALFIGNYMGGKLIYKHHMGINQKI
jgi:uncharacterized membrane protein